LKEAQKQKIDVNDDLPRKKVKTNSGSLDHLTEKEKLEVLKILENDTEVKQFLFFIYQYISIFLKTICS
jgi:hypothetical protein